MGERNDDQTIHMLLTSDSLAVSAPSCVSDSDSVDSVTLQLVYSVAGVSETATSPLTSTTAGLSPHHL